MTLATKIIAGVLLLVTGAIGAAFIAWRVPDQPVSALQAKWAPPPSQFIAVRGMQVHVRDEGPRDDPVPIVLLHGTGASLHTWDGWTPELTRERRVIRFDLPGFGLTGPSPDGVYSIESYVDTLYFGIVACRKAMPNAERLADLVRAAQAEFMALASAPR